MKITKQQLKQIIKEEITNVLHEGLGDNREPNQEGAYKLFEPYEEEPFGTYDSLEKLLVDLKHIKHEMMSWEDWTVETPEGSQQAYMYDEQVLDLEDLDKQIIKEEEMEGVEPLGGRYETHSQIGETYDVLPSEPIDLIFRGLEGLKKVTEKLSADRPELEGTIQYQIHTLKREIISKINNTWNKPDYMGDESC